MIKPCPHCNEPVESALFYGGPGRPPLLTAELTDAICEHIENGATLEVAAGAEGIFERRLYEWAERGRAEPDSIYGQFPQAIARAQSRHETRALRQLSQLEASGTDFKLAGPAVKAITWVLERTRRERYGTLVTVKVEQAKREIVDALAPMLEKHGIDAGAFLAELVAQLDGTSEAQAN